MDRDRVNVVASTQALACFVLMSRVLRRDSSLDSQGSKRRNKVRRGRSYGCMD